MSTIHNTTHPTEGDAGKPTIDAIPGDLHLVVHQAERALIDAKIAIFQRVGALVRPATLPVDVQIDGGAIPAGSLVIEPVNKAWLTETLNRIAIWQKHNERAKGMVPTDCPMKYAEHYLAKKGEWNVRVLTGIVEAPTLRRDGSLLTQPGYDALSGLYLNYTGQPVTVPTTPTKEDAIEALRVLKEPFEEFPFVSEVDRSVALSGLLTAVTRRSVRTAPYHGFDAPEAGSGKGLLVDTCAIIATGRAATTSTIGADEAETEKRLGALLIKGVSVINLDNAARPVEGDFICSLATQETVDPRILGKSETVTVSTNTTAIFLTGNNLVIRGDMTRRVLLGRIDPRCERPDARQFKRNLRQFATENRHGLLSAALTVLRAYVCAGKPPHGKAPYGSFEEWDALVRGALLWLDQHDPLESRERIVGNDPAKQQLTALLAVWVEAFGSRQVTAHEVIDAATPRTGDGSYPNPKGEELRRVLLEVAANRDVSSINSRVFGRYLSKHRDKVIGGYRLEQMGDRQRALLWRVVSAKGRELSEFREFVQPNASDFAMKNNAKHSAVAGGNSHNSPNSQQPPGPPDLDDDDPPVDDDYVSAGSAGDQVDLVEAIVIQADSDARHGAAPLVSSRFEFILNTGRTVAYAPPGEPITLAMATAAGRRRYGDEFAFAEVQS